MMNERLTVGSLFSGIGGIDLGLQRAGFEIVFQVEIDDYCNRVLAKHWPNVPRYRDVRECGAHNLSAVDVLAGGFPCQPHSLAGKRRGGNDDRNLWPEFVRLIRELRPRYVLGENVPGLLSTDDGRFFGTVLRDLAESGYDAEWDCIPAAAVGAPHIRDRVFILAYPNCAERWSQPEKRDDADWTNSGRHEASGRFAACSQDGRATGVAHPDRQSLAVGEILRGDARAQLATFERSCSTGPGQWAVEPNVGRVVDGLSHRMDRLRGLGNAVVPAVAQFVGELILAHAQQVTR